MTTALDIIKGALRRINSYQSGEQIAPADEQDCLETLNDMLDSWSADHLNVFGSQEAILAWIVGQNQYSVGNPTNTDLGLPGFTGTLTQGSNVISSVTQIPAKLVAGSSTNLVGAGSTITDIQSLLPDGTYVFSITVNTITLSANAIGNSQGLDTFGYSMPGDFPMPRPLRITSGFTRINDLDFTLEVTESEERYNEILYKAQPGPWPVVAWYNNTMPYGTLKVYQTPGQGADVHLFTDTILDRMTSTQVLIMPQGYARALKWCLAEEIWAEFCSDRDIPRILQQKAAESKKIIQAVNAQPAVVAKYDRALVRGNRPDGGWIIHGGYG